MSFNRKMQRTKAKALGQLGQATQQIADLNVYLKELPEVAQKLRETGQVLEAVLNDMETLSKEQEFTLFMVRQVMALTSEQEERYRAEWLAKDSECPRES